MEKIVKFGRKRLKENGKRKLTENHLIFQKLKESLPYTQSVISLSTSATIVLLECIYIFW